MMLGLRRFETVNLAFGEETGDSALVEVATRIQHFAQEELEGEWLAARLSGGNFLLALNESCSRERWQWLAETLADLVARPILNTCSAGTMRLWPRIALVQAMPGEGADNLLARPAETLARTQRQAGSRVQWADGDMGLIGRSAQQMEAELLGALDRGGAGPLAARELGRIGASALFAIAERADHVAQLSHHIATRALAGAAAWPEPLRLSRNITPADLAAWSCANSIAAAVTEADFSPDRLTLEITEEALLTDLDRSAGGLAKLRDIGIRIALDDCGAGFCNFRYLKLLPLHYLKLDRVMVDDIVDDPRDLAVFRAILTMAQALGLKVIAEGIENEDQRALIAREGGDYYQGFLRAQPMSADDFAALAG